MDFIGGLPPERTIIMKIMTQDKTRVLNFKMTYISYVSKNRICEGDLVLRNMQVQNARKKC